MNSLSFAAIVVIILLVYFYFDGRCATCASERMISQAQYSTLSRGFSAPSTDDYAAMGIIYNAENANRVTDITLTNPSY